jgi:hypothetical protein
MRDPRSPLDAYEDLGLSIHASREEIEASYYRYINDHPDKAIEATEFFDDLRIPKRRLILDLLHYQCDDSIQIELPDLDERDNLFHYRADQLTFNLPEAINKLTPKIQLVDLTPQQIRTLKEALPGQISPETF